MIHVKSIREIVLNSSPKVLTKNKTVTVIVFAGKQFSLDSRIDLVIHNLEATHKWRHGSDTDDKLFAEQVEVIAEDVPDREGTNERYYSLVQFSYLSVDVVSLLAGVIISI